VRRRRIEFKNRSQGHPRTGVHVSIASRVDELRKKKEKNAIAKVAKEIGKTPRHVARIYSKHREFLRKLHAERSDPETLRRLEAAIKEASEG
jgi:hypothetical protein